MPFNPNNNNNKQELSLENNHDNSDDFIPLTECLEKNKNIDPYHIIMIAKNIVQAFQDYKNNYPDYSNLNLNHFMINQDTLFVQVKHDKAFMIDETDIFYSSPEKLKYSKTTDESEIYSLFSVIIDAIIGRQPLDIFEEKWATYVSHKRKDDEDFAKQLKQEELITSTLKTLKDKVKLHYFGKDEKSLKKEYNIGHYTLEGIELCSASLDRIQLISNKIDQFEGLLQDIKNKFFDLCIKGFAVDPNIRPTQEELLETLEIMVQQLSDNYIKAINVIYMEMVSLIKQEKEKFEKIFPEAADREIYISTIKDLFSSLRNLTNNKFLKKEDVENFKNKIQVAFTTLKENIYDNGDSCSFSIKLTEYLQNNKNIEFYNKIMIAKNIVEAYEASYLDNGHGINIKLDNFIIDPATLSIQVISNDSLNQNNVNESSEIDSLLYDSYEKLNVENSEIDDKKSNVYSLVAFIIDTIIGFSPLKFFDKNIWKSCKREEYFSGKLKLEDNNEISLKEIAKKQFFGQNLIPHENSCLGYYTINGIEICAASYHRVERLEVEISQSIDLSEETKTKLFELCLQALAITPDLRPTLKELFERLKNIFIEPRRNLQNALTKFINEKIQEVETELPGFKDFKEVCIAYVMLARFFKKEIKTEKSIEQFKNAIDKELIVTQNQFRINTYVVRVNEKFAPLEQKIAETNGIPLENWRGDDNEKDALGSLKSNIKQLSHSMPEEKSLADFATKSNELLKQLKKTNNSSFFKPKIKELKQVIKDQPRLTRINYSLY